MLEAIGLENILWFVIIALGFIGFQMDRSSRRMIGYIDKLQDRVYELEKRIGIEKEFDMDPLGFTRDDR